MTDIQDLVDATAAITKLADTYDGKAGEIDDRVNAILPTLGYALSRSIFVNADTGDDATGLGTAESPVRSLAGASTLMLHGGDYLVYLGTDIIIDDRVVFPGQSLMIASDVLGTKRRLTWASEIDAAKTHTPSIASGGRSCALHMRDLTLVTNVASPHVTSRGMFQGSVSFVTHLWSCSFEVPAGSDIPFIITNGFVSMWLDDVTYPAEMSGLWLSGAAAGTDPATVGRMIASSVSPL